MPDEPTPLITTSWDVSEAKDSRLKRVFDYWQSRCGDRVMPSRSDIDPTEIPDLLSFIALVDVLDNPRDFRIRLVGTSIRDIAGTEMTGKVIADVFPPAFHAEVFKHWNEIVDRKTPKVASGRHWVSDRSHIKWEGILLPLSSDGATVNMMLGACVFT